MILLLLPPKSGIVGVCHHTRLYFIYLFWDSILLCSSGRPWTLGYSPASVLTDCAPVVLLYGPTTKGLSLDMEEALPHGILSVSTVIIAHMCVLVGHRLHSIQVSKITLQAHGFPAWETRAPPRTWSGLCLPHLLPVLPNILVDYNLFWQIPLCSRWDLA